MLLTTTSCIIVLNICCWASDWSNMESEFRNTLQTPDETLQIPNESPPFVMPRTLGASSLSLVIFSSKHLCWHDDYCYSVCAICRLRGEFEQQSKYVHEHEISTLHYYLQKSKSFISTPTALQISALQDSTCTMPQNLNDLDRELLRSWSERKVFPFRHSPCDCSQKDMTTIP